MVEALDVEAKPILAGSFGRDSMARLRDTGREVEFASLHRISDELAEFSRTLARLAESEQKGKVSEKPVSFRPAPRDGFQEFPDSSLFTDHMAGPPNLREIIKLRRLRDSFFQPDLFADPAWDILLDLKAARLLPSGEIEDEEDLALLEARDILFARLLQYRAFKEIAASFQESIALADKSFPRVVALDPALASLLPEVLIGVGAARFAAIAERVLTPKAPPLVALEHLHSALVSVAEESKLVVEALRKGRTLSFRNLIQGADSTLVVVARFLALLDLYRQGALRFEQVIALGELQVSWIGSDEGEVMATDEFDIPVLLEDSEPSAEISHENKTEEEENV